MNFIRAKGIPVWVTIIAVLLGLFSTAIGVGVMLNHSLVLGNIAGADSLAITWAGRNAGLGIALLVAVYLRNANGYAAVFAGSILREVSDIFSFLPNGGATIGLGIFFLLVDIVCFVISLRAARQQS